MLEKIFKSKKPSLAELLRDTGTTYTVHYPYRTFTALEVDDHFITYLDQAPQPGQTFSDASGTVRIVTSLSTDTEGLCKVNVASMTHSVSVFKAIATGVTLDGRDRYRISATNWHSVPAQKDELTFRLPAPYVPDRGELIFCDGTYYQIISTAVDGPYCICQTQEFPV